MSRKAPSNQDLIKLMLFFGRIPETHLKSIQSYPFIYFNEHKEDPKLDYFIATKKEDGETVFSYDLSLDLEKNDHLEKRYKGLELAIQQLFYKEAKVKIKINGKEVYKSE